MDQEEARTLAREVGRRATKLGVAVEAECDPCCGALVTESLRLGIPIVGLLPR